MCAAITSAAIGVAAAGYQIHQGEQQKKKAKRALDSYERQELDNAFKDVEISTFGSDLLREENARTSAGLVDAAQQGGSRSIIGAIPKIVAGTNSINQEAAKLIDDQFINREYAIASDNARIEGITENRDVSNIAGLSSQYNAGRQDSWNGVMGLASSAAYLGRNLSGPQTAQPRQQVKPVSSIAPAGAVPYSSGMPFAQTPYMPVSNTPFDSGAYFNEQIYNQKTGNTNSFYNPIS